MKIDFWLINTIIKVGTNIMCRIDAPDLDKVPRQGPLIVYSNHTGQIEGQLVLALCL
jgi:putative hemolysin